MNDETLHIRDRFPDKKNAIDLLIAQDPEFHTMCEDYDACVNALRYWTESKEPDAKTMVNEYRDLVRELQEEITQVLAAFKSQQLD